jgi:molybdopterin converting factor small subunit
MIIKVKLFSTLRHHVPNSDRRLDGDEWDVTEGATVAQVLEMLNLPEKEATILLINGRKADRDKTLNEGDVLHVFPPMAGG